MNNYMQNFLKKRSWILKRGLPMHHYSHIEGTLYRASIYLVDTYIQKKSFDSASNKV